MFIATIMVTIAHHQWRDVVCCNRTGVTDAHLCHQPMANPSNSSQNVASHS